MELKKIKHFRGLAQCYKNISRILKSKDQQEALNNQNA